MIRCPDFFPRFWIACNADLLCIIVLSLVITSQAVIGDLVYRMNSMENAY